MKAGLPTPSANVVGESVTVLDDVEELDDSGEATLLLLGVLCTLEGSWSEDAFLWKK